MEKQTIGWMFMLSGKNGIVRVKVNFDDRFKDDKFYCDNEKITIVSDGVILNKSELFAKYKVTTLEDLLFLLLKKDEFTFFKEFIGPFNGFYRNKETGVLIVWGNQTGDSAPFYYVGVDGNVVVSNNNTSLNFMLHQQRIQIFHSLSHDLIACSGYSRTRQ